MNQKLEALTIISQAIQHEVEHQEENGRIDVACALGDERISVERRILEIRRQGYLVGNVIEEGKQG